MQKQQPSAKAALFLVVIAVIAGIYVVFTSRAAIVPPAASVLCAGPTCSEKLPPPSMAGETPVPISPAQVSVINSSVQNGGVVNLACGQNYGAVTLNKSGTLGNPTVYQTDPACGTNRAILGNTVISGSWITVYNVKVNATGHGVTVANGVSNVTFQGSDVVGGSGFYVGTAINNGGTNFTLDSTEIHGSSDSGMFLHHNNSNIQYSKFYNNGGGVAYGFHHIYMKSLNSIFRNNDFGALNPGSFPQHTGQAISIRFGNQDIYSNYFHDITAPMNFFQESPERGAVRIHNNRYQGANHIMYTDVNSSKYTGTVAVDIIFANNTIQGSGNILFNMSRNTGTATLKNNLSIGSWSTIANGPNVQSNNLWNTATGVGTAPNFALSSGSNAINTGTAVLAGLAYASSCNGTPLSYCDTAPDIGFNEFGTGTVVTPPPPPPPAPTDTIPPAVSWDFPAAGATISGQLNEDLGNCRVTATDVSGISHVEFYLDGTLINNELTAPYSCVLDTSKYSNTTHTLGAKAYDNAPTPNATPIVTRSVTFNNPIADTSKPTVMLTSPANGTTVSGIISANASATDDVGVAGVQFKLDGVNVGAEDTTSPYSYTFPSTLNDGSHTISAVARDVAGNTSDLASISSSTFTVANLDTTPPNPPTSLSGATTQPTSSTAAKVTLSWPAASDVITNASGVKGYYVYRGTMVISPLVAGTSYTDINVPTGSLSYTVRSVDNAGLTSTTTSPAYATTINVPVDTTAPTIPTNVTATAVSSSQINLVWSPSSDTGGSGLRGYNIYRNGSTTPHNTIPLTATSYGDASGLSPSTTYSYTVEAVDNAGNKSPKTVAVSVSTAGTTSADVTPPSVAWVVPAPGDTVRGTLNEDNGNCRATATDSSGIAKVEFYLDGRLTNTEVSDPYSCIIDVRRYSRGWHTIGVQAFDNAGNVSPRVSEEVRFR